MRAPRRCRVAPGRLWLTSAALELLVRTAEDAHPNETGGVLLGWTAADGCDVIATCPIGPGPRAKHRPTRFVPDTRWQRGEIAAEYERSGRVLRYVGDWHSHPDGGARPSSRDRRTAQRIARSRTARLARPLMLILSGGEGLWRPAPYRLVGRDLVAMECTLFEA